MHSFNSEFTEKSKKFEGVAFTVRTLNTTKRAERDAKIAAERLQYTRLSAERATKFKELVGEDGTPEERNAKVNAMPLEKRVDLLYLDEQAQHIYDSVIAPSTIRAALISVTGLELNGVKEPKVEQIIADAPDELLAEIHEACVRGSGLTEGEAKN